MNGTEHRSACRIKHVWAVAILIALSCSGAAQICKSSSDLDPTARTAIESTARRYFDIAVRGDVAALQQSAIPSLASNFGPIEAAVKNYQPILASAHPTLRPIWVLEAPGPEAMERAEFLCGVFGAHGQTSGSAVFVIPKLPPGSYAVAIFDVSAPTGQHTVTFVLQQVATDWKLAGLYEKASQAAGHDGSWYAERGREFKAKGQTRNAWFYLGEARDLLAPVSFMSTAMTDKLYDEMQDAKPNDLPVSGSPPVNFGVGSTTYRLTDMFPLVVSDKLHLVVKYETASVANTAQCYQQNVALIRALVAKFPEFKVGFAGIVARAVEPSGRDYGSLLETEELQ